MYELSAVRIDHIPLYSQFIVSEDKQEQQKQTLLKYFCTVCQPLATRNWMLGKVLGEEEKRGEGRQRLEVRLCDFNVWAKVQDKKSYSLCSLLQ